MQTGKRDTSGEVQKVQVCVRDRAVHTYIPTYILVYIHTHLHTYLNNYTHTHTHTHVGRCVRHRYDT
jgi:hypothetical protein